MPIRAYDMDRPLFTFRRSRTSPDAPHPPVAWFSLAPGDGTLPGRSSSQPRRYPLCDLARLLHSTVAGEVSRTRCRIHRRTNVGGLLWTVVVVLFVLWAL